MDAPSQSSPAGSARQESSARQRVRDRMLHVMEKGTYVPAFSASAQQILTLCCRENPGIEHLVRLVEADAELTSRHLAVFVRDIPPDKQRPADFENAVQQLDAQEVRRLVLAITVMDRMAYFHDDATLAATQAGARLQWGDFWFHSLFVARLTEALAGAYQSVTGKEYLAGLMHDAGKLFLARYFMNEYEAATLRAIERGIGMYVVEKQMFDCNHAELSWGLCEKWKLHRDICRAVRFHHEPNSPFNKDSLDPEKQSFLAACINIADTLARICGIHVVRMEEAEVPDLSSLPAWAILQQLSLRNPVELDSVAELEQTWEEVKELGLKVASKPLVAA